MKSDHTAGSGEAAPRLLVLSDNVKKYGSAKNSLKVEINHVFVKYSPF